jgi:acyl carrier protein
VIEDRIKTFIEEELQNALGETLTPDYPLLQKEVLDSLGLFQLVSFIESEFGVEVADEELVPSFFGSISSIARFVEGKR